MTAIEYLGSRCIFDSKHQRSQGSQKKQYHYPSNSGPTYSIDEGADAGGRQSGERFGGPHHRPRRWNGAAFAARRSNLLT
jgi:hypothetical protein